MKRLLIVMLGACFAYAPAITLSAQRIMEEIVVTATKREESLQDVPIAVSAFSGDDLEKRGVQDLYGLQEVAPSIAIYNSNSTSNGGTIRIRGVGTTGNNPGLEAAVGTFIDGIYRSRAGLAFNDMVDVERVEILRGPQGTLFGKNTSAGALNIVTKKPELGVSNASATVSAGNYDARRIKGHANFSSSDTLGFRLSGSWFDREGHYEQFSGGDAYDSRDRYTLKGQLLWIPADNVSVRFIADYTEKEEDCCPAAYWINGPTGAIVELLGGNITPFTVDSDTKIGVNHEPVEDVEDKGYSLDIEWDINENMTLRSITGWREFEVFRAQDIDFGNADILLPQDVNESFENFSQEFHLIGATDNIDWLFGAYLYTEDLDSDEMIVLGTQGPEYVSRLIGFGDALSFLFEGNPAGRVNSTGIVPNQGYDADYATETEGWSVFTHNTWHMNDRADLTIGLRYSDEEKEATSIINGAVPGTAIDDPFCAGVPIGSLCDNASYDNSADEQEWTGTINFSYQIVETVNTYVSFSRGYKAGGFNLDQEAVGFRDANGNFIDDSHFNPEFSDSWEIGMKGEFLDYRLTLNGAIFHTEFEDMQLNTFTGLGFAISNVDEATSKGIEIEGVYQLSDIALLSFGMTYADARYGEIGDPALNNNRLTQSPLWQGSAALFVEDTLPNSSWMYNFNLNFSHVGEANTGSDLDPEKVRGAFNMVNTSFNLTSGDGRYTFGIWGRNLGDNIRNQLVFDSVFQAGSWSTFNNIGRTFGVDLTVNFGQF